MLLVRDFNQIHVVNALTQESALLTVCAEETMREIQDRYMEYNKHAKSYTWKKLSDETETFVKLNMALTLEQNGIPDDDIEFEELQIDDNYYYPTLHVYFNDDLTYA